MTTIDTTSGSTDAAVVAAAALLRLERAWNHADGDEFGDEFAEDTDFVDIRGAHHHGRTAVALGHQALFRSIYAGSTISYRLQAAKQLTPEWIVVLAGATLDAPGGPVHGVTNSRITAVLGCTDGLWKITNFHNTIVQPEPPPR